MHSSEIIEKCKELRRQGFTLGDIVEKTGLPKTTVYYHIQDIPVSPELKERLKRKQKENTQRLTKLMVKRRKGKCRPGRTVVKPKGWNVKLVLLISHFMFDGEIQSHSCVYNNRNKVLINRVEKLTREVFDLEPRKWFNEKTGVHRISYHYVELADYIREKADELKKYIKNASLNEKKIFLRVFYDDEGSAYFRNNSRRVRGYQSSLDDLKLVQTLLEDFDIESRVKEKAEEIVISRKENLVEFRDKINFSKGVCINPERKNSIWDEKLEKREILDEMIASYVRI